MQILLENGFIEHGDHWKMCAEHFLVKGKPINNKKLANRTYKKELKQRSMMIEVAIQGYMDQHEVSYEEAQEVLYDIIRKKLVSKSKPLMIDGIAKL